MISSVKIPVPEPISQTLSAGCKAPKATIFSAIAVSVRKFCPSAFRAFIKKSAFVTTGIFPTKADSNCLNS